MGENQHFEFSAAVIPSDPQYPDQWGLDSLNLPETWDHLEGHAYVAITDTGIDVDHEDLAPTYANGEYQGGNFRPQFSWDYGYAEANVDEGQAQGGTTVTSAGHGTFISGITAAATDNGEGIAGACWHCSLLMQKISRLTAAGGNFDTSQADWAAGIEGAVRAGAQVLNMSLGARPNSSSFPAPDCQNDPNDPLCVAIALTAEHEVAVVAASGNDGCPDSDWPATDDRVFGVMAIDQTEWLWNECTGTEYPCDGINECATNYGAGQFSVPGVDIRSTCYMGLNPVANGLCDAGLPAGYGQLNGTSFASPMLAGSIGVLRSVNPLLSPNNIRDLLVAHLIDPPGWNPVWGYGKPDIAAAVEGALGEVGGAVLDNRLTPLFTLYDVFGEAHLYTTAPQVGSAARNGAADSFIYEGSYITEGDRVPGYDCFPGDFWCGMIANTRPRASVYLFTTDTPPFAGAPQLVPLYRMSMDGPEWNGNPDNRSFFYTTESGAVDDFHDLGYELDGIEGYVYPRCTPEPSCIPQDAVRLYRLYSHDRDDYAVFPETQLQQFLDAGYVSQPMLNDWIGYVYLNVDSDSDEVIDGFEGLIGTDPLVADSDCDGASDGAEVLDFDGTGYGDPLDGSCSVVIGETGRVTNLTHTLRTVTLSRSYTNPVVIAQPPSKNGSHTSVVRITNVSSNSFTFYIHEAPNMDGAHTTETVGYLVVEAGSWKLADGTELRVGKLDTSKTVGYRIANQWASVSYGGSFPAVPVVLSQVQTENDASWVKTRHNNVGSSSFQVALEKEEASQLTHPQESIGWLAISPADGTWNGHPYVASRTGNQVTDAWFAISFSHDTGDAPQFLAAMPTYAGGNNAELRYRNLTGGSVEVQVEEDTSWDTEVDHTTEVVDYLVLGEAGTLEGSPN